MEIDHIFIFSTRDGLEANDLVDFGLSEGSNRVHKGQGTRNRKFYFENFFIEVLWVHDENEIKSEITSPTKLWERSQYLINDYARFGLCLVNMPETDKLFENAEVYQPNYFPKDLAIDMLTNDISPAFPWTFRLPFKGPGKNTKEPTNHSNAISKLTKAEFGIGENPLTSDFCRLINATKNIKFQQSTKLELSLEFDDHKQGKKHYFPSLSLTISY